MVYLSYMANIKCNIQVIEDFIRPNKDYSREVKYEEDSELQFKFPLNYQPYSV